MTETIDIRIYHYDKDTKEFTFSTMADLDPEETKLKGHPVPLVPAYATTIEPPELKDNETLVFDIENKKWLIKPDYRKDFKVANENQGVFIIQDIKQLGEIEEGYLVTNEMAELIQQNPNYFKIKNGKVVKKTAEEIKIADMRAQEQARIAEIKAELIEIDNASQRSSRAISLCILNNEAPNPDDVYKLTEFENQAGALREELQELENSLLLMMEGEANG